MQPLRALVPLVPLVLLYVTSAPLNLISVPVEWLEGLSAIQVQAIAPLEGTPFWAEVPDRQPAFLRTDEGAVEKQ